ncbi:MAG: hypothetical protein HYT10_01030 [Candidatus Levybacteria bacterium]|nr:hypothetical protein [Candidatus Levybacteria bacterium]
MDTAQKDQPLLPKEPLDLPKPPLDLPTELPKEIPAHANHGKQEDVKHHEPAFEVKTLLAWTAPGRPFRKRRKEFYASSLLIMLFIEIILFLFSQYLLMLVIFSLVFVSFALVTVPPHNFRYRISSEGVMIEDHFFLWEELYDFYFKKRDTQEVLYIRTRALLPGALTLTLGEIHADHIKNVLLPYLPFREVIKPTFMEKAGDWLGRTIPLERP